MGSIIERDLTVFHQTTNQVPVLTLPALKATLPGNPDLNSMVRPFVNGDDDTEAILVRKCIPLPNKYTGLFLSQPDGTSPCFFFNTILSQIEPNGNGLS